MVVIEKYILKLSHILQAHFVDAVRFDDGRLSHIYQVSSMRGFFLS